MVCRRELSELGAPEYQKLWWRQTSVFGNIISHPLIRMKGLRMAKKRYNGWMASAYPALQPVTLPLRDIFLYYDFEYLVIIQNPIRSGGPVSSGSWVSSNRASVKLQRYCKIAL